MHLKDDFILAQRADTLYESLKKCGSALEHEVWRSVGRKTWKAGAGSAAFH